jgi:uncharacterized protein (TIGR02246 family)
VAAIAAADERWLAAFNRADVEGMMALYAPDAIIMPDGEPTRVGREAIRLWQEDYFRRFSGRQTIDNEEIVAARDWAYMRGNWEVTLTPRDGGETVTERGKHLVIWRRPPGGSWLVARDMWNRS